MPILYLIIFLGFSFPLMAQNIDLSKLAEQKIKPLQQEREEDKSLCDPKQQLTLPSFINFSREK